MTPASGPCMSGRSWPARGRAERVVAHESGHGGGGSHARALDGCALCACAHGARSVCMRALERSVLERAHLIIQVAAELDAGRAQPRRERLRVARECAYRRLGRVPIEEAAARPARGNHVKRRRLAGAVGGRRGAARRQTLEEPACVARLLRRRRHGRRHSRRRGSLLLVLLLVLLVRARCLHLLLGIDFGIFVGRLLLGGRRRQPRVLELLVVGHCAKRAGGAGARLAVKKLGHSQMFLLQVTGRRNGRALRWTRGERERSAVRGRRASVCLRVHLLR